jgi:hypothetical protein
MPVSSGVLAAAWTSRYWKDRILGGQREARVKVQAVFMSTGNNITWSRELERRIVPIELVALSENPSLRTGFRHDPLLDWARRNHRALVRACLTLCRHWVADGMPPGAEVMGSYENYARVMGGILNSCGVEGFLANRARRVARNPEAVRWSLLVAEWHRQHAGRLVSTGNLWDMIRLDEGLTERFAEVIGDGSELSQKQRLGRALERVEGRVFGAWRLVRSEARSSTKNALWQLRDPSVPPEEEASECAEP